jgi:hypothetical protein
MKISFNATILAELEDTKEVIEGGVSIHSVIAKLANGRFDIELPQFINEPTIILKEKDAKNGA